MSDLKHTPGPWQAEGVPKGQRPWVGRIAEGRWAALACGNTDEEAGANARLIAAAPDMRNALAQIKELARPGQEIGISDAIDMLCDIYNIASAAIGDA